ncbi:mitogen-activated protein kinase kinase kinase 5-like [Aristolochia californica]|uniref:mitogen-activated protein kinase kinase kinase 5-like n=1 Tax=Aristolochia californica TaxID=171875 RepID=UPI0035D62892
MPCFTPPAMHWWKIANSPSSTSSPKSSLDSPTSPSKQRRILKDLNLFRSRRDAAPHPRLTRLRKLRHLSNLEVARLALGGRGSPRPSASEHSTPESRSPSGREFSSARSSSADAVPLPLPDLGALLRKDAAFVDSNKGCCRLPSPKDTPGSSRDDADGAELLNAGAVGEKIIPSSPSGCMFAYPYSHKGEEKLYAAPHGSILNHGAKMPRTSNSLEKIQTFRQSVPPKSAPASGLSSPEQSPRRLSTGCYPSSYAHMQGPQFWSVQELPSFDKMGFSSRNSLEKFGHSSEWSPLNSPTRRNQSLQTASPSGATTPLHSNTPSDSSAAWHEGLVSVHPLPLPPAATVPSQPAYPPPTKSEVSSMTRQWQKGKLIGSGTFGNVYVATNRETGALCAMKEVNLIPDDPKSAECMQQLEQEIKVLSQLKHPNIVQYYGSEIVEDRFYIFLEYVHPGSISKYVRDHCGAMTESVVRNFTRHILSGLAYLHSKKTIHRDIKGANLLVDASGVVKLADFGMAKHLSGQAAALSMKGSPYWMAPEVMQAMMHKDSGYDLAVDIWSLGCTIIEMFTGKPPWSEYEGAAAMFKVIKNDPPIPEMLSPEGKDFLQCCFRRNPLERPSANLLLEHRFVRNSNQTHDIPGCIQAISRMKLSDITKSPRDGTIYIPTSRGKHLSNGETGQSQPETSKSTVGPRHSPRSTLEAITSLSPPRSNHSPRGPGQHNLLNGFYIAATETYRRF